MRIGGFALGLVVVFAAVVGFGAAFGPTPEASTQAIVDGVDQHDDLVSTDTFLEDLMSITAMYSVTGMTCSHCVAAVTEEVSRLDGVSAVDVDLNAGGDSRVTVTSTAALPEEAVREAVDEAGYTLAS